MGRVCCDHEATINHFSHPHPLQLSNIQPQQTLMNQPINCCSACKLKASGWMYSCPTCNFHLHAKCSKMPKKITHPFHEEHTFNLLAKPSYPNSTFNCDACGKLGDGFSYHCKECSLDLHILCAVMPVSRTHHSHPHDLKLTFQLPSNPNNMFQCDVCSNMGCNQWLYRCHSCDYTLHLDCVTRSRSPVQIGQAAAVSRLGQQTQQPLRPPQPNFTAANPLNNQGPMNNPYNQGLMNNPCWNQGIQTPFMTAPGGPAAQDYNAMIVQQVMQQMMAANAAQSRATQDALLQSMLSGTGNGIGTAGMQTLVQAFAGGGGLPGIGGGGGGGLDSMLQGLLGGGGLGGGLGSGGLDGLLGSLGGFGLF